jgi:hypothetical protein
MTEEIAAPVIRLSFFLVITGLFGRFQHLYKKINGNNSNG